MAELGRGLVSRVVSPDSLTDNELAAWRRAREAHPALGSPFFSASFTRAVARVRHDVRVCVIGSEGKPVAFLPLQFGSGARRLLGAAEPVGGEMSDYFGLIAPPGFKIEARTLLSMAKLSAINFRNLPEEELSFGLDGEQPERGHRIEIGADVGEYWERLRQENESFARELERRERRIVEALGPLDFTFNVADPERELDRLVAMKRAQYRETGVPDALAEPWQRHLLRLLAASADADCAGSLATLNAGGHWVASHFGLRSGTTLHYWFPIFNPALAKFGPGHLLLKHVIDGCAAAGIRTIDRGSGEQSHKSAYVTVPRLYYRGCWYDGSIRAVMYRGLQSLAWRWQKRRRAAGAAGNREP